MTEYPDFSSFYINKEKFTKEFIDEFQYDPEFYMLYDSMAKGISPYKVIEYLFKSKKSLYKSFEDELKKKPMKLVITTNEFEEIKNQLTNNKL